MNRMMRGLHVVGVASVLALAVGQASAAVITTQIGEGAKINRQSPTVNIDARNQDLSVLSTDQNSMIKFTLPVLPEGEIVESARIGLYLFSFSIYTATGNMRLVLRNPGTAWDVTTVTWNNAPGSASLSSQAGDISSDPQTITKADHLGTWVWFDVSALVKGWYDVPTSNYGLRLASVSHRGSGVGHPSFRNFQYATDPSLRPMLEITTIPEPNTGLR